MEIAFHLLDILFLPIVVFNVNSKIDVVRVVMQFNSMKIDDNKSF
jgi:hypothetical protein